MKHVIPGLIIFCLAACCEDPAPPRDPESPAGKTWRTFEFTYSAKLAAIPAGAKTVDLWIPVPPDSVHQSIDELKFDSALTRPGVVKTSGKDIPVTYFDELKPDVAIEPANGNKIAHWRIDAARAKDFKATMTFRCTRREIAARDSEDARELTGDEKARLAPYLMPNKLVTVGGDFQSIADAATKGAKTPYEIARAAYEYAVRTMKYDKPKDNPGWGNGSTRWACEAKFGNCTDFHALVMSIGRSRGIPVKFEMGFSLPPADRAKAETLEGTIAGYHCWAKMYLGGVGWIPVDASEAYRNPNFKAYYFGNTGPDRIQFSSGRDIELVPRQAGEPLNYFIYPYAEADGLPFPVEKAFSFVDATGNR